GALCGAAPARGAAGVMPAVGWCGSDQFQPPLPVAAVLRSWEARFGARLLTVGPGAQIRLLVERPPQTTEAAQAIAAEHFAFCDECAGQGLRHIPTITASLVNAPTWTFWWDWHTPCLSVTVLLAGGRVGHGGYRVLDEVPLAGPGYGDHVVVRGPPGDVEPRVELAGVARRHLVLARRELD